MKQQYYQCLLRLDTLETVAWIPKRGAKVGAVVELLPSHQQWTVAEVYRYYNLSEKYLKAIQDLNRDSLPSVKGMT